MDQILDFSKPLDVDLLDKIVDVLYNSTKPNEVSTVQKLLTDFQNHESSWTRADQILEKSKNMQTKYLALQILSKMVQFKWSIISKQQQTGIKNYIVNTILKKSSNPDILKNEKVLIIKYDEVLVQIIKQEWPQNWRNLIPEIVGASKSSESVCENNMTIFKIMSEEIFDFSNGKMTKNKIDELSQQFNKEFSLIYELSEFVLTKGQKQTLILSTLQTLLRFLNWIPVGYIFETRLLEILYKYFTTPVYRNDSLRCLTEIVSIKVSEPKYFEKLGVFYTTFLQSLMRMLPPQETNFPKSYKMAQNYDQEFIQILGLFLTSFFKTHLQLLEKGNSEAVIGGHLYLVEISKIDDTEVFKACLEYWKHLTQELYFKKRESSSNYLLLDKPSHSIYDNVLSQLRLVMISKMAKPEEVIITTDENGSVIKEYLKDVDSIQLYKSMRETLIFLTHLDPEDTENKMLAKLQAQIDGSEWSWNNLNSLCWAIGSISGAMEEKDEKRFLVAVIKELLGLTENKKGKDNKAIVASNIMYVVGQYPRFLIAHWKFLKTVVYKLFEFMHETHPGVQEMACDTFLKISKKCARKFTQKNLGENRPFVEEIILELPNITCDLEAQHIQVFYEAIGYMIFTEPQNQEMLTHKLMELPNNKWAQIMKDAHSTGGQSLQSTDIMRELVNILKINYSISKSLQTNYNYQLKLIYKDMLQVYKLYSQMISTEVKNKGEVATSHANVRGMRAVKKETLLLIEDFIENTDDIQNVTKHYIPPLFEAILGDYHSSVPDARNPHVLSVIATSISKLKSNLLDDIPKILESVLEVTLPMLTKNFSDYPEHRINFFKLLSSIIKYTFQGLFKIPPQGFKIVINSILWACKHTERNISETGLNMVKELIVNIERTNTETINVFYKTFYFQILNDIFYVLTDTLHVSSFQIQSQILHYLFNIINKISFQFSEKNNIIHVSEYMFGLITKAFPHLNNNVVMNFIKGLFNINEKQFEDHLNDFLVEVKIFSKDRNERQQQQQELLEKQKSVPGLIKE